MQTPKTSPRHARSKCARRNTKNTSANLGMFKTWKRNQWKGVDAGAICTMQIFVGKQEQGLALGLSKFHIAAELTDMLCQNIPQKNVRMIMGNNGHRQEEQWWSLRFCWRKRARLWTNAAQPQGAPCQAAKRNRAAFKVPIWYETIPLHPAKHLLHSAELWRLPSK